MLVSKHPIKEVIERIIEVNTKIEKEWSDGSWSPADAAKLLREARLDRQVSLSKCLKLWIKKSPADEADGRLILAWANLGTMIEGTMQFFLCVHESDYSNNPVKRKKKNATPDELMLEVLKNYFAEHVWTADQKKEFLPFVHRVQQYRNAIHAFQERDIGDMKQFRQAVREYLEFLETTNGQVPYPDYDQYG